jgi:hypothetical protein
VLRCTASYATGLGPLLMRELTYVLAITAIGPLVSARLKARRS